MVGRHVAILGATGAIAGAVATEMAARGATLHLSARDQLALSRLSEPLRGLTRVHTDVVDLSDSMAVEDYFSRLRWRGVELDYLLNGTGPQPDTAVHAAGHCRPAAARSMEPFVSPAALIIGSQFFTASRGRAVMRRIPGAAIVLLASSLARSVLPLATGATAATAASDAIQGLARVLAAEYGAQGPRVLCARVAGAAPPLLTLQRVGQALADLGAPMPFWPTGSVIDVVPA